MQNLQSAFLSEFCYFDNEIEAINNYAKIYNEDIIFELKYIVDKNTWRKDFKVSEDGETATEWIKKYFLE